MAINKRLLVKPPSTGITPSEHFGVVLYEGDGASSHSINGGKFGAAADFNTSGANIAIGSPIPNTDTAISVSAWVFLKSGGNTNDNGTVIGTGITSAGSEAPFRVNLRYVSANTYKITALRQVSGTYYLSADSNITDSNVTHNTWHHVVWTYSPTARTLTTYLNGSSVDSTSMTTSGSSVNDSTSVIGNFRGNTTTNFNGKIDQVRIFQKELSSSEVSTLYAETASTVESLNPLGNETVDTLQVLGDTSCLALYKFENDETDLSGNYNGTGTAIQYAAGRYGQAASFNGSSSKITTSGKPLNGNTTVSISFWAKNISYGDYVSILGEGGDSSTAGYRILWKNSNDGNMTLARSNGSGGYIIPDSYFYDFGVDGSNWVHCAFTVSASEMKYYKNGQNVLTQSISNSATTVAEANFGICADPNYSNRLWSGQMDQVRLFNKTLSAAEVTTLYNENSLVASYRFEGNANDDMRAYDGTASNVTYEYGLGFQPDFIWYKTRTQAYDHNLTDSTRGTGKQVRPNRNIAEVSATDHIQSFDTGGFTVGSGGDANKDGDDYVAWCLKANGGTTSTNNDGNIASTVQLNADAGFAITKVTGSGSTDTFGHGLGSTPEVIIRKNLDATDNWNFYTTLIDGSLDYLNLNLTNAKGDSSYSAPTSTVFTNPGDTNERIYYSFVSVDGFSKFGTYTGNGDTSNVVETGFEPAFIMIKYVDEADQWILHDNKRDIQNPRTSNIRANSSDAEIEYADYAINFLSNGFELLTNQSGQNKNGGTYIYMAFAADPDTEAPTVAKSFSTVTYTGNGSSNRTIEGLGFSPSLLWLKSRTTSEQHYLFDTIRGHSKYLHPNLSSSQGTDATTRLKEFLDDGFKLGNELSVNQNNEDFVAWAWKADDNEPTIFGSAPADDGVLNQNLISSSNLTLNSSGKFTNAITFNGIQANGSSGSIIQISPYEASSSIDFQSTGGSFSAWVYVTGRPASGHGATIFSYYGDMAFNIQINYQGYIWYTGAVGGSGQRGSATLIPLNTWTHLAVTFSSSAEFKTYINNSLVDTVTLSSSAITSGGATVNAIGANPNSGNNAGVSNWYYALNGSIAQVRTFKKVLSSTEVGTLYNESASDNETLQILGDTSAIGVYPLNDVNNQSIVSANANAGFSIVKYEGTGSAGLNVKHGLSSAPTFILAKTLESSAKWRVYHSALGGTKYMNLNDTYGAGTSSNVWNDFTPTATKFQVGSDLSPSGEQLIAYCFHDVAGFSKFGTYTGSSSTVTVTVGFQLDFLMIKRSNGNNDWIMYDTVRSGSASMDDYLIPNSSSAEYTNTSLVVNVTSTGFTIASGLWAGMNEAGGEYIYMAFKIN